MNYDDETFVKVFKRLTLKLKRAGWRGRLVYQDLHRVCDRAGVIELENGIEDIGDILEIDDSEFLAKAIAGLLKAKLVKIDQNFLLLPEFIESQESRQSDKQRQRESRARRLALTDAAIRASGEQPPGQPGADFDAFGPLSGNGSFRDGLSRNVTARDNVDRSVTKRIETIQCVTNRSDEIVVNRAEKLGMLTFHQARAELLRFREQSIDKLGFPRLHLHADLAEPPSGALVELFRKAIARCRPTGEELDWIGQRVGSGELWGFLQIVPVARLCQLPDQNRNDNFGDAVGWARAPGRVITPLDGAHPRKVLGRRAQAPSPLADQPDTGKPRRKRPKSSKPAKKAAQTAPRRAIAPKVKGQEGHRKKRAPTKPQGPLVSVPTDVRQVPFPFLPGSPSSADSQAQCK